MRIKDPLYQRKIILPLLAVLLFAGSYSQLPLFYNNQNTHFEKGLANAGFGHLASDWFVHQTDHIPLFTAFVYMVQRLDSHWIFYAFHGLLAAVYALSLYAIATIVFPAMAGITSASLFFTMFTFLHSPWIGNIYVNYMPDWTWVPARLQTLAFLATNGVAGQYILGPFLQPSAFGVLLIASIALFAHKKETAAIVCAVFAATVETPYIIHAAMLTGGYITFLLWERRVSSAVRGGALALILILPIVLYLLISLYPSGFTAMSTNQSLLYEERLPHHLKISFWFSRRVYVQFFILTLGLIFSYRSTRLFTVLSFCAIVAALLTCTQAFSGSLFLAFLTPWRVLSWLIPISTALILAFFSSVATRIVFSISVARIRRYVATTVITLAVLFLTGMFYTGISKTITGARGDSGRETVFSYVREHATAEQTYLIPLKFEQFRLASGAPVFVDWKSHAFKDSEIPEWYSRVQLAKVFYNTGNVAEAHAALSQILDHASVTDIVATQEQGHLFNIPYLQPVYQDKEYIIFHIENNKIKDFVPSPVKSNGGISISGEKTTPIAKAHDAPQPTAHSEKTFTSPTLGAKFVLIPAGTFLMGSPLTEPGRDKDEDPQHPVTLSRPFYMQTTEVTQGQWKKVIGNNPSYFSNCGDDCPVEMVSWADAQEFIRRLNRMEGTDSYRLPTEAQWEYAARAGTATPFHTGNCLTTDQANYDGSSPPAGCPPGEYRQRTTRTGNFAPNAWGLYDMHGNVWEWVQDRYGAYRSGSAIDPEGPEASFYHVARGGSWGYRAQYCRSASRLSPTISYDRFHRVGFRLVKVS